MHVKTMLISEFKAKCIASVREVGATGQSLVVTVRGKPVAIVRPAAVERSLGALRGQCVIHGNLIRTDFADEWEMNA